MLLTHPISRLLYARLSQLPDLNSLEAKILIEKARLLIRDKAGQGEADLFNDEMTVLMATDWVQGYEEDN